MIVFDSDDFGCNHEISDMCQSHDCRDALLKLREINPKFKATLFAIPGEMTAELVNWCVFNSHWIELAVHGFYHTSNYECEKLTYEEFDTLMEGMPVIQDFFVKGFKAPGWQISNDIFRWLEEHGWWVADQNYNNIRRPQFLPTYLNDNNQFFSWKSAAKIKPVNGIHTHTWNCVGNGIYEIFDQIAEQIKDETDFKFVSEVLA